MNPAADLSAQRRVTRIIAFALWMAVWVYVAIFATQILKGDLRAFFAPLSSAPWNQPILPALCGLGAMMPVPALAMRFVLLGRAARAPEGPERWGLERVAMIVSLALFEASAIYGLVLGFVVGPASAPVSALLFLLPLAAIPFLLPPHAKLGEGV
jgi:F0F1-type ATP synthase membrane subunit c/vacuolar-type H+-ATPase subunit K